MQFSAGRQATAPNAIIFPGSPPAERRDERPFEIVERQALSLASFPTGGCNRVASGDVSGLPWPAPAVVAFHRRSSNLRDQVSHVRGECFSVVFVRPELDSGVRACQQAGSGRLGDIDGTGCFIR